MPNRPPRGTHPRPGNFDPDQPIADVGEWALIDAILPLTTPLPGTRLAQEDDVAGVPLFDHSTGFQIFLKTDTLVQSTDAPPQMTPYQMGAKAVTSCVSDFGCKGINPTGCVVSFCLPRTLRAGDAVDLARGVADACARYGCGYYGGDLNEGLEIVVTPTLVGQADPQKVVGRGGAHPGDLLCVSDHLGRTAVGLEILLQGANCPEDARAALVTAVLAPETPLEQGIAVTEQELATAAMDSSDGIAFSVSQLAQMSGVGAELWAESIPIAPEVAIFAPDPARQVELALYGGEEYCYVWAIPETNLQAVQQLCAEHNWNLFTIGKMTQETSLFLKDAEGQAVPLTKKGFTHFTGKS
ncbi:MAG TPA: thiamine-phosphate kinase [Candidatus Lokiarchaeia archaeon]|nr:thiamine-phosphate kinase [Candidatus Lokiarchaeia archaeon]